MLIWDWSWVCDSSNHSTRKAGSGHGTLDASNTCSAAAQSPVLRLCVQPILTTTRGRAGGLMCLFQRAGSKGSELTYWEPSFQAPEPTVMALPCLLCVRLRAHAPHTRTLLTFPAHLYDSSSLLRGLAEVRETGLLISLASAPSHPSQPSPSQASEKEASARGHGHPASLHEHSSPPCPCRLVASLG